MKSKLTITVDEDLIPRAKRYARTRGMSLSQLVESTLREVSGESSDFVERWRGKFQAAGSDDVRYRQLADKYL